MSRGPDAGTLLERGLLASARGAGCSVAVRDGDWTRWASATFTGARHQFTLTAEDGPALRDWTAGLAEAELPLRGHLVADCTVVCVERSEGVATILVEALTVEER